jgi:hypothetical protein
VAAGAVQPTTSAPDPSSHAATFIHVGLEIDQPYQQTWSVLQDRTGFMWLGTDLVLARYDPKETVNFRHDPRDPTSLGGTIVRSLFEDSAGTTGPSTSIVARALELSTIRLPMT